MSEMLLLQCKERKEKNREEPELGGARLPKGRSLCQAESVDTIDLMGWVDRRAEPCPSAGPRLGALLDLTHYRDLVFVGSALMKRAVFQEPRPSK